MSQRLLELLYNDIDSDLVYKIGELIYYTEFSKDQEPNGFNYKTQKYEGFYSLLEKMYRNINFKAEKKKLVFKEGDTIKSLNEITKFKLKK